MEKACPKCKKVKSILEFYPRKDRGDGNYASWCKDCTNEKSCNWYKTKKKKNPFTFVLFASKADAKRYNYLPCNISVKELEASYTGECAICGISGREYGRRLDMDHNHSAGNFRGWLCSNCNRMLGHSKDSEKTLTNAVHYLQKERV